MEADIRQLVKEIHDRPHRIVLVTAGAGSQSLTDLLSVSGASRTLLEGLVPYNQASFNDFLGYTPDKYVTAVTANQLAGRAFTRARWLESENNPVIGLACTATIITDRPKRGQHRAYIATWFEKFQASYSLYLKKGVRDRNDEEDVVSRIMLNTLAKAIGIDIQLDLRLVEGDTLHSKVMNYSEQAQGLHSGEIECFGIGLNGRLRATMPSPTIILSGSFNPLHDGHLGMVHAASELLGHPIAFELSAFNVEKPPLAPEVLLHRMAQFAGRYAIYASNAPTFVEKAQLYPGTIFVVGYDTAVRIMQPRFYQDSIEHMHIALNSIRDQGCHFLVAGRADKNNNFHQLADIDIPSEFRDLFQQLPAHLFRNDISSTDMRQKGAKGSR